MASKQSIHSRGVELPLTAKCGVIFHGCSFSLRHAPKAAGIIINCAPWRGFRSRNLPPCANRGRAGARPLPWSLLRLPPAIPRLVPCRHAVAARGGSRKIGMSHFCKRRGRNRHSRAREFSTHLPCELNEDRNSPPKSRSTNCPLYWLRRDIKAAWKLRAQLHALYAAICPVRQASAQSESITWHRLSLKTLWLLLAHLLWWLVYVLMSTLLICLEIKDRHWRA